MVAPLIPLALTLAQSVPAILKYFGGEKEAQVAEKVIGIATQVVGTGDPDEAALQIAQNPEIALKFKTAVLAQELDIRQIAFEERRLYVSDTQDARRYRDDKVFRLGVIILVSFAAVMSLALYGLYRVVSGTIAIDSATLAAVIGLVGAIIGYFAANAQQVVSFFFGSSAGSLTKGDNIADAIAAFKRGK